jgi:hypothetical protein
MLFCILLYFCKYSIKREILFCIFWHFRNIITLYLLVQFPVRWRVALWFVAFLDVRSPRNLQNNKRLVGGADRTPTPMPKSVQTYFLENISNLKSSENLLLFFLIPGIVVLFIGSQFTVIKLLECLEHNLIRSLSPRSHSLESYLSN